MSRLKELSRIVLVAGWGMSLGCGVEVLDDADAGVVPLAVEAAFARSCVATGCHESSNSAAGLSLEGAGLRSLVGASSSQRPELSLVSIGDVPGSYLAIKVLSDQALTGYGVSRASGTSRMPLGGSSDESAEDVALILGWIAGAELPLPAGAGEPTGESFETDILPILDARCGCHQIGDGAGGLAFNAANAYDALVGQPSSVMGVDYVVPSEPDGSYLLAKVEGTFAALGGDGDSMPPNPPPLEPDQIALIRTWIELGANP